MEGFGMGVIRVRVFPETGSGVGGAEGGMGVAVSIEEEAHPKRNKNTKSETARFKIGQSFSLHSMMFELG
jgi:hypothetical protein